MQKIYLVEDDATIVSVLAEYLQQWGYECVSAKNFASILQEFHEIKPDLVLLDISLPYYNGYHWCQEIRKSSEVPIIFLSSMDQQMNQIMAMNMGADDYLIKPFLPKELLLRVQAILKRSYPTEKRIIELENSFIDIDKAEIHRENKIIPLTAKEYNILLKLVDNANHIVTIGTLCQTACGEMWQGYETTLMTHIRHLREKIEKNPSSPVSLLTVKGLGYKLLVKGVK